MIKSYPYFTLMIDNWYSIQKIVEDLWTSNQTFAVARTSSNTSVANELKPKQSVSTLMLINRCNFLSLTMQNEGPPTTDPKVSFVSKPAILAPGNKAGCQTFSDLVICSPKGDDIPMSHPINRTKKGKHHAVQVRCNSHIMYVLYSVTNHQWIIKNHQKPHFHFVPPSSPALASV